MKSYIGITGFADKEEVINVSRSLLPDMSRKLMVGVLVSNKTLNGGTNKYPNRYPKMDRIGQIFVNDSCFINMVHYYTDDQTSLCAQLEKVMSYIGEFCNGIQLNMSWPNPNDLKRFKKNFPHKKIVLQINRMMLQEIPSRLVTRCLADYENLIDYVLLDASGGRGKELEIDFLLPYVDSFRNFLNGVNIVVAGGLWSSNLYCLKPLLEIYPNLSIDAEGMLRDGNDDLSIIKAKNYLHEAMTLLG